MALTRSGKSVRISTQKEELSINHHRASSPALLSSVGKGMNRSVATASRESLVDSNPTEAESFGRRTISILVDSVGFNHELANVFRDLSNEKRQPSIRALSCSSWSRVAARANEFCHRTSEGEQIIILKH